ncbi:catecholate siderophore receptor Fiu [Cellvibrio sp. UBA7661]|uniref:catecholate siderophore receptor Fiu n=1 Tax=Cellvibrio sp. UBA7661 TaxID=1946311 RepID=UPI002F35AE0A
MTILKSSKHIVSKKRASTLALTATALSSAVLLASTGVMAADEPQSTRKLNTVKVEADALPDYKAETVSSPKFTQPLRDTPQTIQVITTQVFTQQGATTLTEALRNSAGVGTFYAGENGNTATGDAIYMRGFDTSSSLFVDGIRDLGSISRDLFNIEQVEVVKGPAGTDNGRSAPTGAINLSSKQAYLEDSISGTATTGTDNQNRVTADVNQTIGEGSAVRVNLLWQDSDVAGRDHVNNKRIGIAPSLAFGLDGNTRSFINLLYVKQDNVPDGFVPTVGIAHWEPQPGLEQLIGNPVDSENFYGLRGDHDDVTAKMATYRIEHDFADNVTLTNSLRWGKTEQDYLLSAFMSTGGVNGSGAPTGNIKWTNADDLSSYTLARGTNTFKDIENEIVTDQLNLRVDFVTGGIEHNLSTGVEFTREEQTSYGITSSGSRAAANLYNPDWNDSDTLTSERNGANADGQTDTVSYYIFDTLKFSEKFLVTGGLRADRYETDYSSNSICNDGTGRGAVPCNGAPVGTIVSTVDTSAKDTLVNGKLGAVFKPVEAASIYANFAISQQPPGGSNFQLSTAANSAANPNMDPQKAETAELGTKWDVLAEKLSVNAAVFQTKVTNEINTLDLDDQGNPTQSGEKSVEGIELSAVGNITENWAVTVGYTDMSTDVDNGPLITADGTSNLTYSPEEAFTSWTTYRFESGLMIGGGVRYTAGMHRGTDGAVGTPAYTDSYTVVDAVVSYDLSANVSLRLNAYNLADEEYVASINKSGYRYTPGTPRTFMLSADVRF